MAGFESAGMVLCAATEDHSKVELLEVPDDAKVRQATHLRLAAERCCVGCRAVCRRQSEGLSEWWLERDAG
eukprot:313509-Rhodomonas_salina.1